MAPATLFGQEVDPLDYVTPLARLLDQAGLSVSATAKAIGCQPQTVRYWRSGQIIPHARHVVALAGLLGVDVSTIYVMTAEAKRRWDETHPVPRRKSRSTVSADVAGE
jgi:transcriptional regulator with XRE-family HTH domain